LLLAFPDDSVFFLGGEVFFFGGVETRAISCLLIG